VCRGIGHTAQRLSAMVVDNRMRNAAVFLNPSSYENSHTDPRAVRLVSEMKMLESVKKASRNYGSTCAFQYGPDGVKAFADSMPFGPR
jgi:hypothetical protein